MVWTCGLGLAHVWLDEWLWQKVGLKRCWEVPLYNVHHRENQYKSWQVRPRVMTLRKTLQNVLAVIHTSCLVAACATLLLKLDVLWLRHEWIYVLETKLRAIHTWLVWNGNTTRVPSRHRNASRYVHVVYTIYSMLLSSHCKCISHNFLDFQLCPIPGWTTIVFLTFYVYTKYINFIWSASNQ